MYIILQKNKRKIKQIYNITVEGNQEKLYLKRVQELLNNILENYTVEFKIKNAKGGDPFKIVEEIVNKVTLYDKEDKRIIAVFDNDNKDESYKKAIEKCHKNQIVPAVTNISFDLWLISHKKLMVKQVIKSNDYAKELKKIYKLGNVDIKKEENINKILEQITIQDIKTAIINSKKIEQRNEEKIAIYRFKKTSYYDNPDIHIHKFIERVCKDCELNII